MEKELLEQRIALLEAELAYLRLRVAQLPDYPYWYRPWFPYWQQPTWIYNPTYTVPTGTITYSSSGANSNG